MENFEAILEAVKKAAPSLDILTDEPMSRHCSFRIGGPAAAMAIPRDGTEMAKLCSALRKSGVEPFIMGNGTNLLVTDGPLDRFVVKIAGDFSGVKLVGNKIFARSGASLAKIASFARDAGMAGMEFAHGIPGTLGGAVYMNAGAYGGEMKDVVEETIYLDRAQERRTLKNREQKFAYRSSVFTDSDMAGSIILGAVIALEEGEPSAIGAKIKELDDRRRESQPLDFPSAGSTFKRPATGYAAALIEQAGLKGFSIGGAQVSKKHSGFVVNTGGASFDDVMRIMEHVQETVLKSFGVELEPEVKIIR